MPKIIKAGKVVGINSLDPGKQRDSNSRSITEDDLKNIEKIEPGYVMIHNGKIIEVGHWYSGIENRIKIEGIEREDREDCIIGPGFIDLHFHGYGDEKKVIGSFNIPRPQQAQILKYLPQYGVTGVLAAVFIPRFSTDDEEVEVLKNVFGDLNEIIEKNNDAPTEERARLLGYLLEGPMINEAGAIPKDYIWWPQPRQLRNIIDEASKSSIDGSNGQKARLIVVVAPELDVPHDFQTIRSLTDKKKGRENVTVSLGHATDKATLKVVLGAIEAGATHFNHLFNVMPKIQHREPGPAFTGVFDISKIYDFGPKPPKITVELICDLLHVWPEMLKLAIDARGAHNVAVITDAAARPDMKEGMFTFGGNRVEVAGGQISLLGAERLAGSTLSGIQAFYNVHRNLDLLVEDCFKMMSTVPAQIIGLEDSGVLAEGKRADFVVLDADTLELRETYIAGVKVWKKEIIKQKSTCKYKPEEIIGVSIHKDEVHAGRVRIDQDVPKIIGGVEIEKTNLHGRSGLAGREAMLQQIQTVIKNVCEKTEGTLKLKGIGLTTPGIIEPESGKVIAAYRLPGWTGVNLKEEVEQLCESNDTIKKSFEPWPPDIRVHNDARAMALAELLYGNLDCIQGKPGTFAVTRLGLGEGHIGQGIIKSGDIVDAIAGVNRNKLAFGALRNAIESIEQGDKLRRYERDILQKVATHGEFGSIILEGRRLNEFVSKEALAKHAFDVEEKLGYRVFRKEKIKTLKDQVLNPREFKKAKEKLSGNKTALIDNSEKIGYEDVLKALTSSEPKCIDAAQKAIKKMAKYFARAIQELKNEHDDLKKVHVTIGLESPEDEIKFLNLFVQATNVKLGEDLVKVLKPKLEAKTLNILSPVALFFRITNSWAANSKVEVNYISTICTIVEKTMVQITPNNEVKRMYVLSVTDASKQVGDMLYPQAMQELQAFLRQLKSEARLPESFTDYVNVEIKTIDYDFFEQRYGRTGVFEQVGFPFKTVTLHVQFDPGRQDDAGNLLTLNLGDPQTGEAFIQDNCPLYQIYHHLKDNHIDVLNFSAHGGFACERLGFAGPDGRGFNIAQSPLLPREQAHQNWLKNFAQISCKFHNMGASSTYGTFGLMENLNYTPIRLMWKDPLQAPDILDSPYEHFAQPSDIRFLVDEFAAKSAAGCAGQQELGLLIDLGHLAVTAYHLGYPSPKHYFRDWFGTEWYRYVHLIKEIHVVAPDWYEDEQWTAQLYDSYQMVSEFNPPPECRFTQSDIIEPLRYIFDLRQCAKKPVPPLVINLESKKFNGTPAEWSKELEFLVNHLVW